METRTNIDMNDTNIEKDVDVTELNLEEYLDEIFAFSY